MIVFDLICQPGGHHFEGWFGSSSDYENQLSGGLLCCPSCGSKAITKAVMAPNVAAKSSQTSGQSPATAQDVEPSQDSTKPVTNAVQVPAEYKELAEKLAKAQEKILEKSEWVGAKFPDQARAIHYGEEEDKPIHGTASAEDAEDLAEEGINIAPLPFPVVPPKSQN